jgi:hypothetical protein
MGKRTSFSFLNEWSIGIYSGKTPFTLVPAPEAKNPVISARDISDVSAEAVADPFLVHEGPSWYLFFEVVGVHDKRGKIGLAVSQNGLDFHYERIILFEPFHLSYPYVFKHDGTFYLVPESGEAGSIRLYKAEKFPFQWRFEAEILKGPFCDTTILRLNDRWWLFTCSEPVRCNDLRLFSAGDLLGPWTEHPKSPLVRGNGHTARPGGRCMVIEGTKVIRFAQDSTPTYGKRLNAFEISLLTESDYVERPLPDNPVLQPGRQGWNRHGMHHIDCQPFGDGAWIACVDGYRKFFTLRFEY